MSVSVEISCLYPKLEYIEKEIIHLFKILGEDTLGTPPSGELSLVFMTDDALAELHERFLDDPTPTDVITFPGDADDGTAGEICVSVDMAKRISAERELLFSDELTLYIIHGWLHLCGFDDIDEQDRGVMRKAEQTTLSVVNKHSAMPTFIIQK